jgi:GNAT superfamily N-acetyltransferase
VNQSAPDLEFKDFAPEDMRVFWVLHNYFLLGDESKARWLERAAIPQNLSAIGETAWLEGKRVGFLRLSPERSGGAYREVRLGVLPEARGRRVGTALWNRLAGHARRLEVPRLMTPMQNPDAGSTRFLEAHGFQVHEVSIRSHLELPVSLDMTVVRTLEAQGYAFYSLLEAGNTLENRERLYWLVRQSVEDDPGFQGEFETLEEFNQRSTYWDEADTFFLAAWQGEWVAMAGVRKSRDGDKSAATTTTGVSRSHRGRGLAQAVKLLAIEAAQRVGFRELRTANDSRNIAMLAINRKLGFKPVGSFAWFKQTLQPRA